VPGTLAFTVKNAVCWCGGAKAVNALSSCIVIDSGIRFGKPCIKGTRITVADILGWLAAGMTIPEIIDDYPELQETHIRAALAFAAERDASTKMAVYEVTA
jgi:uncharacterized protein (DUF433 family)